MAGRSVRFCSSRRRAHLRPPDTALSEIEIAPVFHRLPERIGAHASICFKALIRYRVMRQRLKLAVSDLQAIAGLSQVGSEGGLPNRCIREVRQQLREPRIRDLPFGAHYIRLTVAPGVLVRDFLESRLDLFVHGNVSFRQGLRGAPVHLGAAIPLPRHVFRARNVQRLQQCASRIFQRPTGSRNTSVGMHEVLTRTG